VGKEQRGASHSIVRSVAMGIIGGLNITVDILISRATSAFIVPNPRCGLTSVGQINMLGLPDRRLH
jgi:hypothetical protein